MPDVTGRVYEAFTEFILRRLGYRDEWTSGSGRQYLYEKHREALCHTSVKICPYARECNSFSKQHKIPYGPWYDPDFLVLEVEKPVACIHVTHWSSEANSPFKFWRTIEDHFQYKLFFGYDFLSVNFIFESLDEDARARSIIDSPELIKLHGWSPAVGAVLVNSFDATVLFPRNFSPLKLYAELLPLGSHGGTRKRRDLYNETWEALYNNNPKARRDIEYITKLCERALTGRPSPRYSLQAYTYLQGVCFNGRQRSANVHPTASRYRKGLQHAFIIRELIARSWKGIIDPDQALWRLLSTNPRFPRSQFGEILGLPTEHNQAKVDSFITLLETIPIRIDQFKMQPLMIGDAGIGHVSWDTDLSQFILGLRHLDDTALKSFRASVDALFETYRNKRGMAYVLDDLHSTKLVTRKVNYVSERYLGISSKSEFVRKASGDMLTPGTSPHHHAVVQDIHNWVLEILLIFYQLGSFQHISRCLGTKFEKVHHHSLRPYAFFNSLDALVKHLLAGTSVGQFFSRGASLSESEFYKAIWPLVTECLWEEFQQHTPLSVEEVSILYRYKKVMRIIASPDLNPLDFLITKVLKNLHEGPIVRGVFNQLSTIRGWSRGALVTKSEGVEPKSGAIIHAQSVFGRKHIADKTRELAARIRSVYLSCADDGRFEPQLDPTNHYLVVDGDWPVESKINLYEAGFKGIYEIAELGRLYDEITLEQGTK